MDIKIDIAAGSLKDRIPASRVSGITALTLTGSLNGEDIEFIRRHTGGYDMVDFRKPGPLETLDLSECKLVAGGVYKHTEFMGPRRGKVSISQFMEMWENTEYGGPAYGLRLINSHEVSNEMFLKCYKLKKIILPNNITRIGDLAFYRCDNLSTIYLGDKVTSVGEFAFANTALREIHIKCTIPPTLSECAFGNPKYHKRPEMNPKNKITLYVPRGSASDYWLQWGFDNIIEE